MAHSEIPIPDLARRLAAGGACRVRIGPCMRPVFEEGAWVRVEPRARRACVGDVVLLQTFRSGVIIHRLVARCRFGGRTYFVHKGDASRAWGVAGEDQVLGLVPAPRRRPSLVRRIAFQAGALLFQVADADRAWARRLAPRIKRRLIEGRGSGSGRR